MCTGKSCTCAAFSDKNLRNNYSDPYGRQVFMKKSGYMNEEKWVGIMKKVYMGLCELPVACDHP